MGSFAIQLHLIGKHCLQDFPQECSLPAEQRPWEIEEVGGHGEHAAFALAAGVFGYHSSRMEVLLEYAPETVKEVNLLKIAFEAGHFTSGEVILRYKPDIDLAELLATDVDMSEGALNLTAMGELLVMHKADVNRRDTKGTTPLGVVAEAGHAALASLLIENGADLTVFDEDDSTAIQMAALNGHVEVVQVLLDAKAVPATDEAREELLGTSEDHPELVKWLRWKFIEDKYGGFKVGDLVEVRSGIADESDLPAAGQWLTGIVTQVEEEGDYSVYVDHPELPMEDAGVVWDEIRPKLDSPPSDEL